MLSGTAPIPVARPSVVPSLRSASQGNPAPAAASAKMSRAADDLVRALDRDRTAVTVYRLVRKVEIGLHRPEMRQNLRP